MRSFAALVLSSCIALSLCSSPNSSSNFTDVAQGNETCQEYLTYEECVRQAAALSRKCRRSNSSRPTADKICAEFERKLKKICVAYCAKASCLECFDRMETVVESCKHFATLVNCELNTTVKECEETKNALSKYCSSKQCQVCKDLYCRNGGKCTGASSGWCNCPPGYGGAFCQRNKCAKTPCKNGGTCIGENTCKCPPRYSGPDCSVIKSKLGTKENPATNAQAILDAGDSQGSGMYWIQSPGEAAPAKTYCDMSFAGGAWMLASYGYVNASGFNANNKGIPNMNNPFGYNWSPTNRSSTNGLITLPHGAVKMANNARYMIMAAGNNPTSGGIDKYAYVYRISLKNKPYNITFANHNRLYGGQPGRMHVSNFIVEALKGESGTFSRYTLGESLGVTWSDTFPTGYGFNERNAHYSSFHKGPFFPSVHSGSGRGHAGCAATNYVPDVPGGCPNYTHRGWYSANSYGKTGQTSIWFK